ncbi:3-ketodihydrosphingosine reductase [Leptopilina boulardi]|uniref:3-ketodihydrosphingosine reductase n=1 Tax=Leptopilina boulardi TaxID=63433 RepID=UPI0021F51E39|nr:3-ketodihydrosphingosine reductase [Leptopilina boulardi]
MEHYIVMGICIFVLVITVFALKLFCRTKMKNVLNKHVVVTGGSSGIGKSVALIAARSGAHVTIIARNIQKLESAKNEIVEACKNPDIQRVEYLSLDISKNYDEVEKSLLDLEKTMGPIYMLANCAGTAIPGKIEDTTVENLKFMFDVNFFGTFYCTKAIVPLMKSRKEGIIVLTASQAACLGIFGYSGYSSSKFAIRGLAECLSMELFPYNVTVTVSLPPDTNTPGFKEEEKTKPLETKLISQAADLMEPDDVAKVLFKDALAGKFFSIIGFESFIVATVCAGMSPFSSWCEVLIQSILMGLLRIVGAFYLISFHRIIIRVMKNRDKNKRAE